MNAYVRSSQVLAGKMSVTYSFSLFSKTIISYIFAPWL